MDPVVYVFTLTPEPQLVERNGVKKLEGVEGVDYLLQLFPIGAKKPHGKYQVSIEAGEGDRNFASFRAKVKKVVEPGGIHPTPTTFEGRIGPGFHLIAPKATAGS